MMQKRLWAATGILAVIVFGGFALSVPHTRDAAIRARMETAATTTPVVTLSDSYRKGVHTLSGSLTVPNACTSVTANATVLGSASSTSGIALSLSAPADDGVCLDVPQTVQFSATVTAPKGLPIIVTVNGTTATTTGS